MKLAEALKEKSRLKKEITRLRKTPEKSVPANETPKDRKDAERFIEEWNQYVE